MSTTAVRSPARRRDALVRGTRVLLGLGQFLVVWGGWVGFAVAVVYACGGLTRALMRSLLNVTSWSTWQPWAPFGVEDITDGTVATVLGLMGLLLWLAAIGHLHNVGFTFYSDRWDPGICRFVTSFQTQPADIHDLSDHLTSHLQ